MLITAYILYYSYTCYSKMGIFLCSTMQKTHTNLQERIQIVKQIKLSLTDAPPSFESRTQPQKSICFFFICFVQSINAHKLMQKYYIGGTAKCKTLFEWNTHHRLRNSHSNKNWVEKSKNEGEVEVRLKWENVVFKWANIQKCFYFFWLWVKE